MSRLESMGRRIKAQIDGLNWAARAVADVTGDVLELGLGNGRTYDHLRQELPDRPIWVIDRVLQAHASCVPPAGNFLQGEAEPMLQLLAKRGVRIALAHYEFGIGDDVHDAAEAVRLSPLVATLMVPDGIVVSQQKLVGMRPMDGPDSIAPDRYNFYRA